MLVAGIDKFLRWIYKEIADIMPRLLGRQVPCFDLIPLVSTR
jgi:hypothetical protein